MASTDSFWSLRRLTDAFSTPEQYRRKHALSQHASRPLRTAVVTEQHIETIGGKSSDWHRQPAGPPRLPIELIICIVLLAAHDASQNSIRQLQLASVNRACHTAVMCKSLLPNVCLFGPAQMRAFLQSLELNALGLRDLAQTRVCTLTFRHHDLAKTGASPQQRPALFDASSAQLAFERDCMPLIRSILRHLGAIRDLSVEGVPRSLSTITRQKQMFDRLCSHLASFNLSTGHYAGGIEPSFWTPSGSRWSHLTHLQLHGPQFRFNASMALALGHLPQLTHLALVVPAIVRPDAVSFAHHQPDAEGRLNPLQVLVDNSTKLQVLLLVGHADKHFVGFEERLRFWLRAVRQRVARDIQSPRLRIQLVTLIPSPSPNATPNRVHPSEVSTWMMDRAELGLQWSFALDSDAPRQPLSSSFQHCLEEWDSPDMCPSSGCGSSHVNLPHPSHTQVRVLNNTLLDDALDSIIDSSDDSA